ncbi:MAG: hypothetical protein B1H08_01215 [Candidatus Omnitrophica bacterium 4484_171]|nr:MAG: hypothetical protein B1H08_01215 [Candidatus Omnitrophica bacterium 4484_171]
MKEFDSLVRTMKILRSKDGCRWDRAQKLKDLKNYLMEEAYELMDTIGSKHYKKVEEELGDVFLILVFICQVYSERNRFNIKDVLKAVDNKMIRRHPHVFSSSFKKNNALKTKNDIVKFWVKEKAKSKKRKNIYERLPRKAPSLLLAYLLYKEKRYLGKSLRLEQIVSGMEKKIQKLNTSGVNGALIADIIMDLSKLASLNKINLEILLRRKIFLKARSLSYQP